MSSKDSAKEIKETDPRILNRQAMDTLLARLDGALQLANLGGGEKYNDRHVKRGKLLPRERIDRLLDPGSYFLELMPLAGHEMAGELTGAGVIGGVGLVAGSPWLIVANECTVKAGAISRVGVQKLSRLAVVAMENHLPVMYLVESAGLELPTQGETFVPTGREFRDLARRSKMRLPTVAVVFGTSTAGGAYLPGMSDYVILVRDKAHVFLGGPPLVRMATGEVMDEESLGGAEMHATKSGLGDFLADDEEQALGMAREIAGHIRRVGVQKADRASVDPEKNPEELLEIPSANKRIPFEAREILARIVDAGSFFEFKPLYGPSLVTGWARIHGFSVGFLANNGVLDAQSAAKGAHFIALCNQSNTPILFFQNTTGFMVGKSYEETGIIRYGSKLVAAVSNSKVPAITIMMGSSYGAGNYAMCGRAYEPRFLFSWPNHRIAVMGGAELGGVMSLIKRESAEREGRPVDEAALAAAAKETEAKIESQSDAFYATARLWDDGILDPRDTRNVLGICLSLVNEAGFEGTMAWGVVRH